MVCYQNKEIFLKKVPKEHIKKYPWWGKASPFSVFPSPIHPQRPCSNLTDASGPSTHHLQEIIHFAFSFRQPHFLLLKWLHFECKFFPYYKWKSNICLILKIINNKNKTSLLNSSWTYFLLWTLSWSLVLSVNKKGRLARIRKALRTY